MVTYSCLGQGAWALATPRLGVRIMNKKVKVRINVLWSWCWWSSGQRASLLLQWSEFDFQWRLQFFCKIVVEKNDKNNKRPGLAHFKKRINVLSVSINNCFCYRSSFCDTNLSETLKQASLYLSRIEFWQERDLLKHKIEKSRTEERNIWSNSKLGHRTTVRFFY